MFISQFYENGVYNVGYNVCAILLSVVMLCFSLYRSRLSRLSDWAVLLITAVMTAGCLSENTALLMRNDPSLYRQGLCNFVTVVYHSAYNIEPYFMFVYILSLTRGEHRHMKKLILWMSIPEVILTVFLLVPPLRHMLFYPNPGKPAAIIHGPLYGIFYAVAIIYLTALLWVLLRYKKAFGRRFVPALCFILISFLTVPVQFISPYLKASRFLQTLCILGVYIVFIEDKPGKDVTTGLLNGYALLSDAGIVFQSDMQAGLIIIKIANLSYYRSVLSYHRVSLMFKKSADWLADHYADNSTYIYCTESGTFSLLFYDCGKDKVIRTAEEIRQNFPEVWEEGSIHISVHTQIWAAFIPENISTVEQLNQLLAVPADSGLDNSRIYFVDRTKDESRRIAVEQAIDRCLKNHRLQVWYQPIYDTKNHCIHSAEALVRMFDTELGFVSPEEFIGIAEANDTIHEIGEFVFNEVCRFIHEDHPEQYGLEFIELNVSAVQCMDAHLPDRFRKALNKYHVDPSRINLEITESAFVSDTQFMKQAVKCLQDMGFSFSMDDFGTGYSNYTKMVEFPFSIIKIDKSILWALNDHPENEPILASSVKMCRDLKRHVVVEGVETEKQKDLLIAMDTDYLQGYYYSRPLRREEFLKYVQKFNGWSNLPR